MESADKARCTTVAGGDWASGGIRDLDEAVPQ
jgi:hypothetical protein